MDTDLRVSILRFLGALGVLAVPIPLIRIDFLMQ